MQAIAWEDFITKLNRRSGCLAWGGGRGARKRLNNLFREAEKARSSNADGYPIIVFTRIISRMRDKILI
jgi:hypothetical protein